MKNLSPLSFLLCHQRGAVVRHIGYDIRELHQVNVSTRLLHAITPGKRGYQGTTPESPLKPQTPSATDAEQTPENPTELNQLFCSQMAGVNSKK